MAKEKRSDRDYIDAGGNPVDRIELATGARYSLGKMEGEKFVVVQSFDQQIGPAGKFETMNGILGFHTKAGNVANTTLNDKDSPGSVEDAALAILEWIENGRKGVWVERVGGGGVQRYNPDHMAAAIAQVTGKPAADYLAKMTWKVNNKGEQVTDPNAKGIVSYPAFAYRNAKVKAAYDALAGTGTSVDSL